MQESQQILYPVKDLLEVYTAFTIGDPDRNLVFERVDPEMILFVQPIDDDLQILRIYDPVLLNACIHVFVQLQHAVAAAG